jgi:hypothetical protein
MNHPGYYTRVGAYRDRLGNEELPNGIGHHEITMVMSDESDAPDWRTIRPAVCHLRSDRAREFAFELLALATAAEQRQPA